jgi:hypothetical protein
LTSTLKKAAENTLRSLEKRTPPDLILPLIMNKTTGLPEPPRGALRSQVAVLGSYHAYNGLIPPSWAHGYPRSKKLQEELSFEDMPVVEQQCGIATDDEVEVEVEDEFQFNFEI